MIKSQLIANIASDHNLTIDQATKAVEAIFNCITDALAHGNRVELRDFGVFSVRARNPKTGRNPRTGDVVHVPAKVVPFFKTGRGLLKRINQGSTEFHSRCTLGPDGD